MSKVIELTSVSVWSAEGAIIVAIVFHVAPDGLRRLAEAGRVHPFLAGTLTLEHLLLIPMVVFVIGLPTDAVVFWLALATGACNFVATAPWRLHIAQNEPVRVLRRNVVRLFELAVHFLVRVDAVTRGDRSATVRELNRVHFICRYRHNGNHTIANRSSARLFANFVVALNQGLDFVYRIGCKRVWFALLQNTELP